MSYINEIEFDFEPGDRYELSPTQGSYVIGKILALGGEVYVDGNAIVVVSIPGKPATSAPVPEAVEPTPAPAPPEIPAAVEKAPSVSADRTIYEKNHGLDVPVLSPAEDLAAVEEAVIEVAAPVAEVKAPDEVVEAPIKRAPKPQVTAPKPQVNSDRTKKIVGPKLGEI